MKRLLAVLLIAFVLTASTSCSSGTTTTTTTTTTPTTVPSMVPSVEGQLYVELGVAAEGAYRSGGVPRNPWDVEMYNGRLYVASGDFDKNAGPVYVWYYDFDANAWEVDSIIEDEQISRFNTIDGKLYLPGIDPKVSWDVGSYYRLDGEEWDMLVNLPGSIHNFDIVKHDGKLFAGIGVQDGNMPALVTTDEETWTPVNFYRDGELINTTDYTFTRVYDFFTLSGELYAYLSQSSSGLTSYYEIYHYDGENFVLYSELPTKLNFSRKNTYTHFHQRVEYKGYQYLANGNLYRSADMITAEKITPNGDPEINDLRVVGDKLYALCSEEYTTDGGETAFYNSLQVTTDGKTFTEVFRFSYPVRALSFTYENGTVFIGMGFGVKAAKTHVYYDENGMILAINRVL